MNEIFDQAFFERLQVDLLCGGDYDAADTIRNFAAFQNGTSDAKIGDPAIRAGTDNNLLDRHALGFCHRFCV